MLFFSCPAFLNASFNLGGRSLTKIQKSLQFFFSITDSRAATGLYLNSKRMNESILWTSLMKMNFLKDNWNKVQNFLIIIFSSSSYFSLYFSELSTGRAQIAFANFFICFEFDLGWKMRIISMTTKTRLLVNASLFILQLYPVHIELSTGSHIYRISIFHLPNYHLINLFTKYFFSFSRNYEFNILPATPEPDQ